jgi:hypothetical protein
MKTEILSVKAPAANMKLVGILLSKAAYQWLLSSDTVKRAIHHPDFILMDIKLGRDCLQVTGKVTVACLIMHIGILARSVFSISRHMASSRAVRCNGNSVKPSDWIRIFRQK